MSEQPRALSFGAVAAAYERHRPGYPAALVDAVLGHAVHPVATAFEIGAGTGKATRAFAARGVDVTASEPDAAMLDELRRQVPGVTTMLGTFEQLTSPAAPPLGTFDLVFAAAALHWTEPTGRWQRVAALMRPGGVFASFGGPFSVTDAALAARLREVQAAFLVDDAVPSPDGTPAEAPMQWPGTELEASSLFDHVRQRKFERRLVLSRDEYLGHLGTVSAYLILAPATRTALLAEISEVLPDRLEFTADLTLHLARAVELCDDEPSE